MNLKGKNVAVLGAGGSGLAATALALGCGATVAAFDSGSPEKLAPAVAKFAGLGVVLTTGDAALSPDRKFDLAVISPGIDENWPLGKVFQEAAGELIGELELAWRLSDVPVIAITGTNGKTTTTGLIAHMLNACGKKAVAAGNIGYAYSEAVHSGEDYEWIVIEASSFQLETIRSFQPQIAIWTNFAPDHMDRYAAVEDYRAAKMRIFENRDDSTFAILKKEDGIEMPNAVTFSAFQADGDYRYEAGGIRTSQSPADFDFSSCQLHGLHNAENVMMALAVADRLDLDRGVVAEAIQTFEAPEHRCEPVAKQNDITWVNDSKSTNLHSLESALRGQEEQVILICGGKEKGLDYAELSELAAGSVKHAVCIGETAGKIEAAWGEMIPCETASSLHAAVEMAGAAARSGDVILFSPGTSSFDMFSGYIERGNQFREAVQQHLS